MKYLLVVVGLWSTLLIACAPQSEKSELVARVNEVVLTKAELDDRLPDQLDDQRSAAERTQFIEEWVSQELLYQEATERNVHRNALVYSLIEQARRDLVVAAFLDSVFGNRPSDISDKELSVYYVDNKKTFERSEDEIKAQHILLSTKRDADALRQNLLQGDDFEKAAKDYSLDQETKMSGGNLGYFTATSMPQFWEKCYGLPLGMISKTVSTERGYHIFRVLAHEPAGSIKELQQVRMEIVEALVVGKYQNRLEELIGDIKTRHDWKIFPD